MIDVVATVTAADLCSVPRVVLASIVSSEPEDAPGGGDGSTLDDIQDDEVGSDDRNFRLRAERQAGGPGRIYTVEYSAADASGNLAVTTGSVRVPHNVVRSAAPVAEVGPGGGPELPVASRRTGPPN